MSLSGPIDLIASNIKLCLTYSMASVAMFDRLTMRSALFTPPNVMLHVWTLEALLLMVNSHEGRKPSSSWTRPPGRPRRTWLNLVKEDAKAIPLSSLWRTEISRGHGAAQNYAKKKMMMNVTSTP